MRNNYHGMQGWHLHGGGTHGESVGGGGLEVNEVWSLNTSMYSRTYVSMTISQAQFSAPFGQQNG